MIWHINNGLRYETPRDYIKYDDFVCLFTLDSDRVRNNGSCICGALFTGLFSDIRLGNPYLLLMSCMQLLRLERF